MLCSSRHAYHVELPDDSVKEIQEISITLLRVRYSTLPPTSTHTVTTPWGDWLVHTSCASSMLSHQLHDDHVEFKNKTRNITDFNTHICSTKLCRTSGFEFCYHSSCVVLDIASFFYRSVSIKFQKHYKKQTPNATSVLA